MAGRGQRPGVAVFEHIESEMDGVGDTVGRVAQRNQHEAQPRILQRLYLLCDEGFGQSRVAFEYDCHRRF